MKKVDVVLGLQWGDEGKGKVVDVLNSIPAGKSEIDTRAESILL